MTLTEELAWRGFNNQTTLKDLSVLDNSTVNFYWGCDPSSDSLTIGNLATAMMARCFIAGGHRATLLIGGATGMIGDPKDTEERQLKTIEEIDINKKGIEAQYKRIFNGLEFEIVDNYEWFKNLGYLKFLREIGKNFSMSQLLDREFVKSRVGSGKAGLSYAEFSYSLIQGYDFLHLYRTNKVTLQLCGADQWGNSLSGVDLIRKLEGSNAHIWSAPLIVNKTTGVKFGKSEVGAIWLDESKTSVFKFYQFWLNVDDEAVMDYLKIYTLLDKLEIDNLAKAHMLEPHKRQAQKVLAYEVTKIVHGEQRSKSVQRISDALFSNLKLSDLTENEIDLMSSEITAVKQPVSLTGALIAADLANSHSEANRLLASGGISLNGEKVSNDCEITVTPSLIKKGKNNFILVTNK